MKRDKKLIKIANELAELEEKRAMGKDVKSCESKIQRIADSLSLEDMMIVDEYVMNIMMYGK